MWRRHLVGDRPNCPAAARERFRAGTFCSMTRGRRCPPADRMYVLEGTDPAVLSNSVSQHLSPVIDAGQTGDRPAEQMKASPNFSLVHKVHKPDGLGAS